MRGSKTWRRLALGAALAATAALAAGVGAGQAATSFAITLDSGIGTGTTNAVSQVSLGGEIGYHLFVENTGDSNTTHVTIVVTSDSATFLDASNSSCVVNPRDAHEAICTPPDSTMNPGDTLASDLRFTAPARGTSVTTSAAVTIAAQTVGGKKNHGTTIATSEPALTDLVSGDDVTATFLRGNEPASTGRLSSDHPQNFGLTLPPALLGNPFAVAVSIHDQVGTPPDCGDLGCLASYTTLSIPLAATLDTEGNPFYDGTNLNAYSWTMSARYSPGFKLTGVVHDGEEIPSCDDIGGAPTADDPLCWDTLEQVNSKKIVSATGRGLENGNLGFN